MGCFPNEDSLQPVAGTLPIIPNVWLCEAKELAAELLAHYDKATTDDVHCIALFTAARIARFSKMPFSKDEARQAWRLPLGGPNCTNPKSDITSLLSLYCPCAAGTSEKEISFEEVATTDGGTTLIQRLTAHHSVTNEMTHLVRSSCLQGIVTGSNLQLRSYSADRQRY